MQYSDGKGMAVDLLQLCSGVRWTVAASNSFKRLRENV